MKSTLAVERSRGHLERVEAQRKPTAKAHLKKLEMPLSLERRQVGRIVERMCELAGLDDKEAAVRLKKDSGQFGRWISGHERPHLDLILAAGLGRAFFLAYAEVVKGDGIETEHVVHVRAVNE